MKLNEIVFCQVWCSTKASMIEENKGNEIRQMNNSPDYLADADDISLEELQIQINKLSIPEEQLNALSFFQNYLENDFLPPEIFVQLHNFILRAIQNSIGQPQLDLVLNILTEIAEFLNDELDFSAIVNHLLRYLPLQSSFEAISAIASNHITAARFLISVLPNILSFISSFDTNQQHGCLLIILSILNHQVLIPDMITFIGAVFDVVLSGNTEHLSICFSILTKYSKTEIGYSEIEQFSHLSQIFDHYKDNPECVIPILKFLDSMCSRSKTSNPLKFIERTNSIPIIMNAAKSPDQKVQKALCQLLHTLSKSEQGIEFLFRSEILEVLFFWLENAAFSVSSSALKILCSVCSNCPHDLVMSFVARGLLETLVNYMADAPVDLLHEILTAIQTMVLAVKGAGDQEKLASIEDSELVDAIWQVCETNHDNTIGVIASFIYDTLTSSN